MTQDEYDALSTLKRRFLHIVKVPADRIPAANAYYHICERGLKNKVDGEWKWWHEKWNDERLKDIHTARMFVCHDCDAMLFNSYRTFTYGFRYINLNNTARIKRMAPRGG